jgi:hypothetical protein
MTLYQEIRAAGKAMVGKVLEATAHLDFNPLRIAKRLTLPVAGQPLGHLSNRKKRCRPILLNRLLPQLFRRTLPADTNLRFRRLNRNTGQALARRGDPFSQPSGSSAF